MPHTSLYQSRGTWRSFGKVYTVYADRIELAIVFRKKNIIVPVNDIISCELRKPLVVADAFRLKNPAELVALKLDLADLFDHVIIIRKSGFFKRLHFTPDDPQRFVHEVGQLLHR